jgi:addiction module HigA family antidote
MCEVSMEMFNPPHPGEVLRDYMGDVEVTDLSERMGIARTTLSRLLNGHHGISALMALKLSEIFPNTRAEFWASMQMTYDLWQVRHARKPVAARETTKTRTAARSVNSRPVRPKANAA